MNTLHELKAHIARCASRLKLTLPTSREDLKTAFKAAAQESHPDKGGSAEDFRAVKEAHSFLLENLESIKCFR